ncbi:MAG: glutathione peroxidase [Chthoniobacter sp.]|uniref:glutathione peroxidase n=1 Tax=Chthoniobacter sp. TaxID=2510640 RepID=UPI0032ADCA7D
MATSLFAEEPAVYSIPLKDIDGKETTLKAYSGKALLIVNVASECGFTPQYEGLEALYRKYKDKGLVVLGFPCNDFGQQEPGSNDEIKKFCSSKFSVTFPMFDKLHTKGPEQHPLYAALSGPSSPVPGKVTWNFNKYLISRDGKILAHYESDVEPDSTTLTQAIDAALAGK